VILFSHKFGHDFQFVKEKVSAEGRGMRVSFHRLARDPVCVKQGSQRLVMAGEHVATINFQSLFRRFSYNRQL
jgi:hypothetical protein